ncbi:hypothetical protein L3Q82_012473, partial [Scortum barcoo]
MQALYQTVVRHPEELEVELLLCCIKKSQLRWFSLSTDVSWTPSFRGFA